MEQLRLKHPQLCFILIRKCNRCSKATSSRSSAFRPLSGDVLAGKRLESALKCGTCTGCMHGISPEKNFLKLSARTKVLVIQMETGARIGSTLTATVRFIKAHGSATSEMVKGAWTGATELLMLAIGSLGTQAAVESL